MTEMIRKHRVKELMGQGYDEAMDNARRFIEDLGGGCDVEALAITPLAHSRTFMVTIVYSAMEWPPDMPTVPNATGERVAVPLRPGLSD